MYKKWSLLEQGNFLKRTGELLERGYSYSEAVESILYQMPSKRQKELNVSLEQLKSGQPLYTVLANLKFQKDLIGYIYFADKHGGMLEAISEGSKLTINKNTNLQKLKKAFFYPSFLFFITIILFIFVDQTLLPQYFSLYESMGLEVNLFTKIIASFSSFLPVISGFMFLTTMLMLVVYFSYFSKLPILQQRRLLLKFPLLGPTLRLIQTQYFTLQLGYLLSGGLSVHESLQLFETAPKSDFYRVIGIFITEKLKRGEDFPNILNQLDIFERELPYIFHHGQTNGKLDKELQFFSQSCLKKIEGQMDKCLKLIQPVLYGLIALLVISMYLSIMIPMFKIINGI
jgi:competence protein ComGB